MSYRVHTHSHSRTREHDVCIKNNTFDFVQELQAFVNHNPLISNVNVPFGI